MIYSTRHKQRRRRPALFVIIGAVGMLFVVTVTVMMLDKNYVPYTAIAPKAPSSVVTRLQFVGDVFWGRYVQRRAEASNQGLAYLTSGLPDPKDDDYDAWIGNFECPVTKTDISYERQKERLQFNCRPEYLAELARWFTAASLANNHTNNNRGKVGQAETRRELEKAGIQHFGSYDMQDVSDICEVVAMPAHTSGDDRVHIPVALCGYMYVVAVTPTSEQLATMTKYAKVMPVIALPHMGEEYKPVAESAKQVAYRRMIDAGADMVIGAHPHVIQNSESYKGKLIAYSLGNFLFDQQSLGKDTSVGLAVGVNLRIKNAEHYINDGNNCLAHKDTCLQTLQTQLAQRPSIAVEYRFNCYDQRSGVPQPGDNATCHEARQVATVDSLQLHANW